jgi:hypothetical protein
MTRWEGNSVLDVPNIRSTIPPNRYSEIFWFCRTHVARLVCVARRSSFPRLSASPLFQLSHINTYYTALTCCQKHQHFNSRDAPCAIVYLARTPLYIPEACVHGKQPNIILSTQLQASTYTAAI